MRFLFPFSNSHEGTVGESKMDMTSLGVGEGRGG